MISNRLHTLYLTALQMETLLPSSTRQYRAMYAALEHDITIALDGVAQRMIEKYNIPTDPECTVSNLSTIAPKYQYDDTVLDHEATNDPPS